MRVKFLRSFLGCSLLLMSRVFTYAQLRPEVTSRPKQPSAAKTAQIVIQTSPEAQVFLDDVFKGQTSAQGRLVIENPGPGDHKLRITLAGKKDYEQRITVSPGQGTKVSPVLPDIPKPEVPKPVAAPSTVVIETSPGAQIYLDDTFKGQASPQGRLVIENPKPSEHSLRVTLAGKKDYEQQVTVIAGETANVRAALLDATGSIRVRTSAGAEISLDGMAWGKADGGGQLVAPEVAAGAHQLRVAAPNKKDYRQTIEVLSGQEARVEARLQDLTPPEKPFGTVYFILDVVMFGRLAVFCDGVVLAQLPAHRYFAARIDNGPHVFTQYKQNGHFHIQLNIEPGGQYFLKLDNNNGQEVVPEAAGRALIAKDHPLEATDLKDARAFVPSF